MIDIGHPEALRTGAPLDRELYDLASDPDEQVDLTERLPFRTRLLLQRVLLQRHRNLATLAEAGGAQQDSVDPDTLRALRALGYVR